MQRDMHYYGTYAMARAAGLAPKACQIIATAAEFVDDNGSKETIEFPDGGRLDFIPTAHHTLAIKNIDRHAQRLIWVPFHFIPGNKGKTTSERLLCRKDSVVAREMIDHNLSLVDKSFGLYLAGISAHVYADTFSHYGFSGVSSRWNRINASSFNLGKLDQKIQTYIKKKAQSFRQKYRREMGRLPNFRDLLMSSAAETLSGALGHGAALTYPDRPYLRWQFDYEHPERRSSGLRDNPATFLDACRKLHDMFHRLGKQYSDARQDNGQPFESIKQTIAQILAIAAPRETRELAWKQAAKDGKLFVKAENILPYQGPQWAKGLDALRKSQNSGKALKSHIFRFYQAAATHRTFVLRDLLPRYGLVVD